MNAKSSGGWQDRSIRALMSVVDDLGLREEAPLLRSTLEHVVAALELPGGATFLREDDDTLTPAVVLGVPDDQTDDARAVAAEARESGQVAHRETMGGWIVAAPLLGTSTTLGALVLLGPALEDPPDDDLLAALGRQIGNGIENLRQYAELHAASNRLQVLHRITSTLTAGLDMKAVIPEFAAALQTVQDFNLFACGFVNESGDYIEMTTHPEDASWGFGSVLPVVGSGPGAVVLNNQPVLQQDLVAEHRFIEDMKLLDEGLRSYAILPLHSRGRSVGVLAFGARATGVFDDETVVRLQPLADSVAVALENIRLFQRTREMSITDEITPLFNFRFFHQILERELKLVDRYRSVLSVIFLDLDRFKPINDTYGHLRGSRVLREVGFLLRAAVRETDYPARYGGDEFVVILPQTDRRSAEALAEKLRRLIEGHTFLQEEGINARIGVSLGVASYPQEADTKEKLVRLADERMYADKQDRTRHDA